MATFYKVLGQAIPSASTTTNIYTVPANSSTVISTLAVCNTGSGATIRVAVRPAGTALNNNHYIIYENGITGNESQFYTLGLTLAATDVLTVYSSSGNVVFNVYGSEMS